MSNVEKATEKARRRSAAAQNDSRRKRTTRKILLDHDALKREEALLRPHFEIAEQSLPAPKDKAESDERDMLLLRGIATAGIGALAYLRHQKPTLHRQIVQGAIRQMSNCILKRDSRFELVHLNRYDTFWGRPFVQSLHAAHAFMLPRIRKTLKLKYQGRVSPAVRIASSSKRYGETQHEATQRYHRTVQQRAEAVYDAAAELVNAQIGGIEPPGVVSLKDVRHWIRKEETAAQISYRILGIVTGKSTRQIKALLDRAPMQRQEVEEVLRNFDLRGDAKIET